MRHRHVIPIILDRDQYSENKKGIAEAIPYKYKKFLYPYRVILSCHASMPPARFFTLVKPAVSRIRLA